MPDSLAAPPAEKVGALVPTYRRPDLLRACVLQLLAQSRRPDVICVHQNGSEESYEWAVRDLDTGSTRITWLHTVAQLPQHEWYAVPLENLIAQQCTHFFWIDHDDVYLRDHVETGMRELAQFDFCATRKCGLLFTKANDYRFAAEVDFTPHPSGGMSASACFRREVARQMFDDLRSDRSGDNSDNVVARMTLPKFRCTLSMRRTCIYHSHEGSHTSAGWLKNTFG
jgi:hypothetical protein